MQTDRHRLILTPPRLARLLALVLAFVFFMHGLTILVAHGAGYPVALGFVPMFHVDFENNLPTFVACILLVSCGLVSAWSSALEGSRPRHRRAWMFLAALFLLLAADEAFSFHEQLGLRLYAELGHLNLPMYAWVVPYGLLVILLGGFLLRWFLELERAVQLSFFAAGGIFLAGAIGFELMASDHYEALPTDRDQYRTLTGDLLSTVEEACEFAGASYFLHTVLKRLGGISFRALGADAVAVPARERNADQAASATIRATSPA
jgi:hypothetical protein